MAGEESAAVATDTGGDAGDAGVEATDVSAEAANDNGGGGEAKTETPAEKRYKARLFGKEQEFTADEMRARLDDDYDWEFHGVAGKPLLDENGQPLKRKWRDIARDVASAKGAADAARRANEERKRFEQLREWGKAPENRVAYMQRELGVDDFESWALERAAESFQKRQKMVQLAQQDPVAYERELRAEREQADKNRRESEGRLEQRNRQEQERQQGEQRFYGTVKDHLSKVGVPMNARTKEIVQATCQEWADAKADLSFEQLAEIVRDEWHGEMLGYLDGKPDEELLKLFGDKRRERLRKAELVAMKGAKQAAKAETPKPAPRTNGREKAMTAEEFMRASRNGGRV